jgi:hypothetical protein
VFSHLLTRSVNLNYLLLMAFGASCIQSAEPANDAARPTQAIGAASGRDLALGSARITYAHPINDARASHSVDEIVALVRGDHVGVVSSVVEGISVGADGAVETISGLLVSADPSDLRSESGFVEVGDTTTFFDPGKPSPESIIEHAYLPDPSPDGGEEGTVDRLVLLSRPIGSEQWVDRYIHLLSSGKIDAEDDIELERAYFIEEQSLLASSRIDDFLSDSEMVGQSADALSIVSRCKRLPCVVLRGKPDSFRDLAASDGVVAIHPPGLVPEQSTPITGGSVVTGNQMALFLDDGFQGYTDHTNFGRIQMAILEGGGGPNSSHNGFRNSLDGWFRISAKRHCGCPTCFFPLPPCIDVTSWATVSEHATAVSTLALGDVMDGQDSAITTFSDRRIRSGYGQETMALFYHVAAVNGYFPAAVDDIISFPSRVRIANMSGTTYNGQTSPTCVGNDPPSLAANELFRDGTFFVKSAGNMGHPDTNFTLCGPDTTGAGDCRVTPPGSAIGAFTVGAYSDLSGTDPDGTVEVRTGDIWECSSRGGTGSQGDNRTIVDIAVPGTRTLVFSNSGQSYSPLPNVGGAGAGVGTSFAAPVVAGAAAQFIDWYKDQVSNSVDDPAVVFTWLLAMGDRQSLAGSLKTSRFDNVWGAGRLRLRKLSADGMDTPWQFQRGDVCLGNGESLSINLQSGNAMPDDVDIIKAVAWWYDVKHEAFTPTPIDDFDLAIQRNCGSGFSSVRTSNSGFDNKEMVFFSPPDTCTYRVRITTSGVTGTNGNCAAGKTRVYWAWFLEDSDRDDSDGPAAAAVLPED